MKKHRAAAFVLFVLLFAAFNPLFANTKGKNDYSGYIKIYKSADGTPHICAKDLYGVFYGYGCCFARDRLFQLEVLRRSVEGTLAEIFGEDFVETDFISRRDGVSEAELQSGLNRAGKEFKTALKAFADGINRVIGDAKNGRLKLDKAFEKAGIFPKDFTQIQILNIFAGTMAARYNDFAVEMDNELLLNNLRQKYGEADAKKIFNDIIFYEDPDVYTTLGEVEGIKKAAAFVLNKETYNYPNARVKSLVRQIKNRNKKLKSVGIPDKSGSYGVALSMLNRGEKKAYLMGGPQMGYFRPSAVYCVGLHTPKFDIVGTTPSGYLFIMFAANRNIAFTATAGVGNQADIIRCKQCPKDPSFLVGQNFRVKKHSTITEIAVKNKKSRVKREIITTELGPVIAFDNTSYFIKQRGWKGLIVESYEAWFNSNFAEGLKEYNEISDKNALSINWLAADRQGNISFVHCGIDTNRQGFGDDRLPVSRPTSYLKGKRRLVGLNPQEGFYTNWNCPPANGYRDGDMQPGWAADQRTKFLADNIRANKQSWSYNYLVELDKTIAFTDLRAYFFKDFLCGLINQKGLSAFQQSAFETLVSWNGLRSDNNGDGYFDSAGAALFETFFNRVFNALIGDKMGNLAYLTSSDPTWTQSSVVIRALKGQTRFDYLNGKTASELVTKIFAEAVNEASRATGALPLGLCPKMEFSGINHIGAPTLSEPVSEGPFMNRGTDLQLVVLTPEKISVTGCLPPGNPSEGKNALSQINDYRNFVYKKRALTLNEVKRLRGGFSVIAY